MLRHTTARAFVVVLIAAPSLVALGVACSSFSGNSSNTGVDGATDANTATDATNAPGIDATEPACAIAYVDGTSGSDTNDGCTTQAPKRSIGAALHGVASGGEVHVCAGAYDEAPITVDVPVALLGSYDCGTFAKSSEAGSGATPSSSLECSNATTSATLLITGAAASASARVDGFAVQGGDAPGAAAILVTNGAAPTLSNLIAVGGGGASLVGPGSIGMRIDTGASPIISFATIDGGKGTSSAGGNWSGSVGLLAVASGPFTISQSSIDGGTGTSTGNGTIGVNVSSASATSTLTGQILIETSTINGGKGVAQAFNGYGSLGAAILSDPRVLLRQNQITSGVGSCGTRGCVNIAVLGGLTTTFSANDNEIFVGAPDPNPVLANTTAYGILSTVSTFVARDNLIIAGGASTTVGIQTNAATTATIVGNTIVGEDGTDTVGLAIVEAQTSTAENNFFVALSNAFILQGVSASGTACAAGLTFNNNAFAFNANVLYVPAYCNDIANNMTYPLLVNAIAALAPATSTAGNLRFAADCTGDTGCTTPSGCMSALTCYDTVLASPPSTQVLFGNQMRLAASPPCALTKGGAVLTGESVDIYGDARPTTIPPSIGAEQYVGTTCE